MFFLGRRIEKKNSDYFYAIKHCLKFSEKYSIQLRRIVHYTVIFGRKIQTFSYKEEN